MNSGRWRSNSVGCTTVKSDEKSEKVSGLYLTGSPMCKTIGLVSEEETVAKTGGIGGAGEPERGVALIGVPGGMGVLTGSAIWFS